MKLKQLVTSNMTGNVLALLSGLLLVMGYAPFSYSPVTFISISLLLTLWLYVDKRQAFIRGFLFGLGLYGLGVSWVYISMHDYGNMPVWLAALFTFSFVMLLAIFPAVVGYVLARFFAANHASKILLAFPAAWVLAAWVQSWIFSGFPWLDIGYTQLNTPLRGLAPYAGVYGITFAITLACALIIYGALNRGKTRWYCAAGFLGLWVLGFVGGLFTWTTPSGDAINVSLVQGNISQNDKWQPEKLAKALELYQNLTQKNWKSDIIVWPEAAVPTLQNNVKDYLDQLSKEAAAHHASIILGIPTLSAYGEKYFNSLIVIGNGYGRYNKRRLVPFGEFTPQENLLKKFLASFDIPMSDFSAGAINQPLLKAGTAIIAPFICYESAFAEQVRRFLGNANLIVVINDDSWFGHSWASDQHLQMTQMRALETGRFVLFSNNTSNTAIIDSQGHIIQRAPDFETAVVTATITSMQGNTPWTVLGFNPLLLLVIMMLIAGGASQYQLRKKQNTSPP